MRISRLIKKSWKWIRNLISLSLNRNSLKKRLPSFNLISKTKCLSSRSIVILSREFLIAIT